MEGGVGTYVGGGGGGRWVGTRGRRVGTLMLGGGGSTLGLGGR